MVSTALSSENVGTALVNANKFFRENDINTIGFAGCYGNAVLGGVSANYDPDGK